MSGSHPPAAHAIATNPVVCPLCGQHFRAIPPTDQPIVFSCGHTLCARCADASGTTATSRCVICMEYIHDQQMNAGLAAYAEAAYAKEAAETLTCVDCFAEGAISASCFDQCVTCNNRALCIRHAEHHRALSHVLGGFTPPHPSPTSSLCSAHPGAPLDHFCDTDATLVCTQCAAAVHRPPTHRVVPLPDAITAEHDKVKLASKRCRSGAETARLHLDHVAVIKRIMVERAKVSKAAFEAAIEAAKAQLDTLRASVLASLEAALDERMKALNAQSDELYVAVGQLKAATAMCEAALAAAPDDVVALAAAATSAAKMLPLVKPYTGPAASPMIELVLDTAPLQAAVGQMTWLRTCIDGDKCVAHGRGLISYAVFDPADPVATRNSFTVTCYDARGAVIEHITPDDVCVNLVVKEQSPHAPSAAPGPVAPPSVRSITVIAPGQLEVVYIVPDASIKALTLHITAAGSGAHLAESPHQAERECIAEGTFLSSIPIESGEKYGLAVRPDEQVMLVSFEKACHIQMYELPSGAVLNTVGRKGSKPGEFNSPCRLCFSPDGASFLATDYLNYRLQEFDWQGNFLRAMPVTEPRAVACSEDLVAVGTSRDSGYNVQLLEYASGRLLREIGPHGDRPGSVLECFGVRFTADASQVIAADATGRRVSVFNVADSGFVGAFGDSALEVGHKDVAVLSGGNVAVADVNKHRIAVFARGELVRSFGNKGAGNGQFMLPTALAVVSRRMYVLDSGSSRVQVFE